MEEVTTQVNMEDASAIFNKLREQAYNKLVAAGRIKEAMRLTGFKYKPWKRVNQVNGSNALYTSKIGRNTLCTCGSNRKVKHCCGVVIKYSIKKDE